MCQLVRLEGKHTIQTAHCAVFYFAAFGLNSTAKEANM